MNLINRRPFLRGLLAIALAVAARAQTIAPASTPAAPSAPFPGYVNSYLRAGDPSLKPWDIGVNVRIRSEDKDGAGTTKAGSNWDFSERPQDDTSNQYQLLRVMPRVGYNGAPVSFLFEGRSSYSFGDERFNATAPGQNLPERDGPLDIYQAYLLIPATKDLPVSVKLGRQELVYGDQRLVGHARWLNVPRTFDGLKVRYETPVVAVDAFSTAVVYTHNNALNRSNPQDLFSGVYVSLPRLSKTDLVETYLLARNVARGIVTDDWSDVPAPARFPAPQDLYTLGVRFKSKPGAHGPWDYTVEAAYQFGSRTAVFPATTVAAALAASRLDQSAYALIAQAGYTWPKGTPWSPRLAVIASVASGDSNPADNKSGTFQNLFPSNHLLYGAMDLTGLQNARDLRFSLTAKPHSTLTLNLEVNLQALDKSSDFWYNAAGAPRNFTGAAVGSGAGYRINPAYGTSLGQEVDLLASWAVTRGALLEAGASHFFRGDYVKESLSAVGSKDAAYVYLQLTLNL
ncbi:alginate export family protein [Opitutus sp. GAS368]|uniref:alginate export family protein n=1 Tax=Opitutus sp. GAS368 TaxID=1882749 RepID=UPI00087B6C63|nr:alginate export family protein [Opitutus sp. GAS368]SDS20340.1 Alginate export [Opitutus sp. GAS368]